MFFARIVALIEWLVYTSDNLHFLLKLVMKVPSIFSPSGALQYQLSSESSILSFGHCHNRSHEGCNLFIYFSKDLTGQHSEPGVSGIMPAVFVLFGSSMIFCQFVFRFGNISQTGFCVSFDFER